MNYSEHHVQHLLSGIDRISKFVWIREETLGQMRCALREGDHAKYRFLASSHGICLCDRCHVPTLNGGTKRCNGCWELERRINHIGDLSMWGSTPSGIIALHRIKKNVEEQIQLSPLKDAFLRGEFT